MIRFDKFHSEIPKIDHLPVFYLFQFGRTHKVMLFQFVADQSQCQLGSIDRNIDLFQHIRKSSDMILMPMSDHKSLHLGNIFLKVCYIRNDQIDSQHIVLRERKTTVYNYNTVAILKSGNVHSDLLQTAKWYDLKLGCCSAAGFPTGWPAAGLCRFLCVSAVFYSATGCCFLCCWPERLILTVFAATTILSCS